MVDIDKLIPGTPLEVIGNTSGEGYDNHVIPIGTIVTFYSISTHSKYPIKCNTDKTSYEDFSKEELQLYDPTPATIDDIKKHLQL